jgi:uncharacterized protein DUF6662
MVTKLTGRSAATASLLLSGVVATSGVSAGENMWVYAKGTDTRPEGSYEFKYNHTIRSDKSSGDYTFQDIRPELEYGITDKLTVSGAALIFDHDYAVGSCDDGAPGPMCEAGDGTGRFNDTQYAGFEINFKYNIYSPYKDGFGLSLGLGYEKRDKYRLDGSDIDQDSFVGKIFLQKDFMDDTLVTVLNIKTEFERRKGGTVLEEEIALDVAAAVSYRVAPKWFVGVEFRHQSDYLNPQERDPEAIAEGVAAGELDSKGYTVGLDRSNFDLGDFRVGSRHQYGNYFGPSVHYAEKQWWVTAGLLWQISGGGSEHADVRGGRNYDEHEKMHLGLFYGYEF